jgi:hypothetical protein
MNHYQGDGLRHLVGADVLGQAALDEQRVQRRQHVVAPQQAGDHKHQSVARELVDHRQDPELPPVMGAVRDDVVGPDMVRPLRP